jgi:large subunit ribosomal protein L31
LQNTISCVKIKKLFIERESRLAIAKNNEEVKIMREGIHPNYHQATVTCNCGNTFVTGSTKESIHVEICSKCHSFYTGQQKAAAARGRIDKFNRKYGITK